MIVLTAGDKIISERNSKEFNQLCHYFHEKNVRYSTLAACIIVAQEDIVIRDFDAISIKSNLSGKCYEVRGEVPEYPLEYIKNI